MIELKVKPLSVNEAWQGRRFKTSKYKKYEALVLALLPKISVPDGKLTAILEFGFSNKQSDTDNPVKPIIDILQKKYLFNDNRIYKYVITKKDVSKGCEYIKFELISFSDE